MSDTASIEIGDKLTAQYRKRIIKKVEKQQGPIRTLVWRSGISAIMILAEVQDVPFEKLTASLYFLCNDLQAKELTQKYESLLELAGAAPDRFVDCLHKELNVLSIFIKENHLIPELFEMISITDRVRFTYHKDNPQAIRILNAYKVLILQTLEYLRPSKFDFDTVVCGCSSHGEILTAPEYYARIDSISYEVCKTIQSKKDGVSLSEYNILFENISAKCGYPEIKTWKHLDEISRMDSLLTDQRSSLCTYINEYTYDMAPKPDTVFDGQFDFLFYIFMSGADMNQIEKLLTKRKKTLPSNGVLFKFEYDEIGFSIGFPESKRISEILMKEVYHDGKIVMLYNVTVNGQILAGYYDTADQFLSSLILGSNSFGKSERMMYQTFRSLVLYLYAAATSKDTEKMLVEFSHTAYIAYNADDESRLAISIKAYAQGGKPKNYYQSKGDGSRTSDERYESVSRPIQGFIRKLPAGHSASQEAKDRAAALGFDLAPDETYVQPFIKNVLRLKEKNPCNHAKNAL